MNSIKSSGYASFKYRGVLNNDPVMQDQILREEKWNKSYGDHCHDIFQGLYQKEIQYNTPCDPAIQNLFDSIKETPDFQSLKERTHNKAVSSFIGMQEMLPKLRNVMKELQENGNKPLDPKKKDEIRQTMRKLVKSATEKVEESEEAFSVCGIGNEQGINTNQDIGDALTIAKRISNDARFQKIIDMAGRLMRSAESTIATETDKAYESLVGVCVSDEVEEITSEEFLKDDDTFTIDMIEGNLFCNKYKGKEKMDSGPIVVCVDRSGSMEGFPFEFSNAILFALYLVAKNSNRPFIVNLFSYGVESFEIKELKDILRVMKNFDMGGTNFEAALQRSFEQIQSDPEYKKADIIFITDGYGSISEDRMNELNEIKKNISLKIISLMIGYSTKGLEPFSDKVFKCTDEESSEDFCKEVFTI